MPPPKPFALPESLLENWPEPHNYFSGLRTAYACPADNLLCFVRRDAEGLCGARPQAVRHHRWVWILVQSGAATTVVRGRLFHPGPGEMLLIPGNAPHYHTPLGSAPLNWFFLTFESGVERWRRGLGERLIVPDAAEREHFIAAVQAVRDGRAEEAALRLALFHEQALSRRAPAKPAVDPLLARVREWAVRERDHVPTLAELARELGGSESHLRQRFRDQTGLSLGRYLLHLRMVRAAEWLRDPRLSITEIALRCGYSSPGNFSRAFQKETGRSPRAHRGI